MRTAIVQMWKTKGDWPATRADFDHVLTLNPKQPETWNNRANLRVLQSDWTGALADYSQSLTLKPTVAAYHNRSLVWQQLGKRTEAEQDMVESQKIGTRDRGF